jgi:hypothetical protein
VGLATAFFSTVVAGIEAVHWASMHNPRRPANPSASFEFPPNSVELDPQPLLLAEFEYARETASQAMHERSSLLSYYLVVVSIMAGGTIELLTFETGQRWHFPSSVSGFLLWGLVVVGWLYYLSLIRLRQAWGDSALAMNRIKALFVAHPKNATRDQVLAGLHWRPETLPALDRKWNVFHYSALLLSFLNGMALALGTLLMDLDALGDSKESAAIIPVAVVLGVAMMAYGVWMYSVLLQPRSQTL